MAKKISLLNQRFGRLTVIKYAGIENKCRTWLCLCDCGKTRNVTTSQLNAKSITHCGCQNHKSYMRQPVESSKFLFEKQMLKNQIPLKTMNNQLLFTLTAHAIATVNDRYEHESEVGFDNGLGLKYGKDYVRLFLPIWEDNFPSLELVCEMELAHWSITEWEENPSILFSIVQYGKLDTLCIKQLRKAIEQEITDKCFGYLDRLSRQGLDEAILYLAKEEFAQDYGDVVEAIDDLKLMITRSFSNAYNFFMENCSTSHCSLSKPLTFV